MAHCLLLSIYHKHAAFMKLKANVFSKCKNNKRRVKNSVKRRRKGHKQRQILVIKRCKRSAVLAKQTINQLVQKAMLSNTKETLTVLPAKTDSDVVFCLQLHVY